MHAIIVGVRIVLQLKEMWVVNAAEATDVKIREECQPGKPIPVFSETAHKVADVCLYYGSASLLRHYHCRGYDF